LIPVVQFKYTQSPGADYQGIVLLTNPVFNIPPIAPVDSVVLGDNILVPISLLASPGVGEVCGGGKVSSVKDRVCGEAIYRCSGPRRASNRL